MSCEDWQRRSPPDPDSAERDDIEHELRTATVQAQIPGVTVVSAEFFDELLRDLDQPSEPNPALARAAARLRRG